MCNRGATCGVTPVTVNSVNGSLHRLIADLGIELMRVQRAAAAIIRRPHVFLQDLLDAARRVSKERMFIVKADIELEMTQDARERLAHLGPMQAVGMRQTPAVSASRRPASRHYVKRTRRRSQPPNRASAVVNTSASTLPPEMVQITASPAISPP